MPNVSILVAAQDNYSSTVKTMTSVTKGFSKDVESMEKKLNELNKNKITLTVEADKAKKELETLKKQFAATGDAADEANMQIANEKYETVRRNLGEVTRTAKDAEKAIRGLNTESSKADNKAGGFRTMMGTVAASGALKMGGDMLADMTQSWVGSMYGSEASNMFSGMMSGATSGAAIGNMLLPGGIGLVAGGIVGSAMGIGNGYMQNQQQKDESFKGVVQSEYDRVDGLQQSNLTAGMDIAAGREMNQMAFSKLLKSDAEATKFLDWVKDTANSTPFLYDDLTSLGKSLKTYGYDASEVKDMLLAVGDTGAALGADTHGMTMMINGLGRIKQSGKTNLEYLNPMIERGVPVWELLQKGLSELEGRELTVKEIQEMSSRNEIDATDAVRILIDGMKKEYGGMMEMQAKTFTGLSSTYLGWQQELQAAMGEGYTEVNKRGLEDQIDWMSGEQGEKLMTGNKLIGQYQANLENKRQQSIMDARTEAMESSEYQKAIATASLEEKKRRQIGATEMTDIEIEAAAEAGRILMEAETKAQIAYQESDAYKLQLESQKTLVGKLRETLVEDGSWEKFGYEMGLEFGYGIQRANSDLWKTLNPGSSRGGGASNYLTGNSPDNAVSSYAAAGQYAYGMIRVPFDNFPAMLHEGERVLTASQARAADSANTGGVTVTVTGNEFNVRQESDIDDIAAKLAYRLQKAGAVYGGG